MQDLPYIFLKIKQRLVFPKQKRPHAEKPVLLDISRVQVSKINKNIRLTKILEQSFLRHYLDFTLNSYPMLPFLIYLEH